MRNNLIFTAITCLLFSTLSYGQSGLLDATFGSTGIISTDITPNRIDFLSALSLQDDQKILAAGTTQNLLNADFAIVRYHPDGSLDSGFGNSGITRIDFNNSDDRAYGMTIQSDGRIIVVGEAGNAQGFIDFALTRLNTDGSIDSTFGTDGIVTTDLGTTFEFANAVVLQSDGKIIAAGKVSDGFFSNFAMVRYHINGDVDEEFGNNGIVTTNIREEDEAKSAVVQPDGKIILSGFASTGAKGDFAMVRYLPDGTRDKLFGNGGIVLTDLEGTGRSDFSNDMLLEEDGKIVLAGNANFENLFFESEIGVVRYNPDGSLDEDFANNGIYILRLGTNAQIQSIARQPDGKYFISGKSDVEFEENKWLMARLRNEGGLDTFFADQGIALIDFPAATEIITASLIQRDSRVVAGGLNEVSNNLDFALARYIADYWLSVETLSNVICPGDSNASVAFIHEGGIPPFEYVLNGIHHQDSIFDNLPAGDYTITVIDERGVSGSFGPVTINDAPMAPDITIEVVGNSILFIVDPPGDLLYSIDGGINFSEESEFSGLNDGVYDLYVMTQTGCIIYVESVLIDKTNTAVINQLDFTLAPNPCKDFIELHFNHQFNDGAMIISDLWGRTMKQKRMNTTQEQLTTDVSDLANGLYFMKVIDGDRFSVATFIISR